MIQAYSQMTNAIFKTDTISATLRAQNHITGSGGCEALIVMNSSGGGYFWCD